MTHQNTPRPFDAFPRSHGFSHAITRLPSNTITRGLRAVDTGAPDLDLFRQHHADYVATLRETGARVTVLDPLEEYPDSVFVEDAALLFPEGAVVMRPRCPHPPG